MANAFYNRGASFNPDELADGDAIEAEFDSVGRGFDTIENLVNVNKAGYPTQTFHVAPATESTHAVQKDQLDSGLAPKLDAASYTSADVLDKLKTVDGSTSGLDADLLDGQEGSYYRNASNINNGTLAKERLPASIDASTSGNAATASKVSNTAPDGGTADLVSGVMAGSDFFRIRVGGGPDAGWTEIATADNGNEPIYVRQYNLNFGSVTKELKLLDEYGNTVLPGLLQATRMQLKNVDGGFGEGNGDAASSSANNVKISSWFGIGFGPSITGHPVPYGEYSHWFNTRNGDMGVRGTITAPRFAGNADTASNATNHINTNGSVHGATPNNSPGNLMMRDSNGDVAARYFVGSLAGNADTANRAGSALNNSFFTATNGGEGRIGATCAGYQPAYLYNNSDQWGVYSLEGGIAFNYKRGAGFNFYGHANSATQVTAVASGDWGGVDLLYGRMATDDYFRLRVYGSGYDQGAVEIATSSNGNEPIHVRQYTGGFDSVARTLTLLDGNGNTSIPGITYGPSFTVSGNSGGLHEGNGDSASSTANNVKIASWYGIGFSPSIGGQPVPYAEYSHWFNTRNGDAGMRGSLSIWGNIQCNGVLSSGSWLSSVAVLHGTIANGGTIPLPSGFTEAQCKWIVSMNSDNPTSIGWDINEGGANLHYKTECYTTGRVVTARTYLGSNNRPPGWINSYANYIIIGVK